MLCQLAGLRHSLLGGVLPRDREATLGRVLLFAPRRQCCWDIDQVFYRSSCVWTP